MANKLPLVLATLLIACTSSVRRAPPNEPPDRDSRLIQCWQKWETRVEKRTDGHSITIKQWWFVPHEDLDLILQDREEWIVWAIAWKAQLEGIDSDLCPESGQ